jgi:hypothetical protein
MNLPFAILKMILEPGYVAIEVRLSFDVFSSGATGKLLVVVFACHITYVLERFKRRRAV